MSAGPSDRERISALEEHSFDEREERRLTREKLHRHAGQIQAATNDIEGLRPLHDRVTALETFRHRLVGMALGFGALAGLLAALILKLIER